jgi:hypothetical protein
MDPDAHRGRLLPHNARQPRPDDDKENANPNLAAGGEDREGPRERRGALALGGPVLHPGQLHLEPELAQVPPRVEDVLPEQLAAVGQPVHHQIDDGVGVDALLRAHVAGLEQHAPPEVLDPLPDQVVHLVLSLRARGSERG